ncbi:MAG: hypothetical protein ACP5LP_01280 [Candidatus Micrarchaeia archaeon]
MQSDIIPPTRYKGIKLNKYSLENVTKEIMAAVILLFLLFAVGVYYYEVRNIVASQLALTFALASALLFFTIAYNILFEKYLHLRNRPSLFYYIKEGKGRTIAQHSSNTAGSA